MTNDKQNSNEGVEMVVKGSALVESLKKTRTPRTVESITAGALSLPLAERVQLVKILKESIDKEVQEAKQKAEEYAKIAGG